MITIIIGTNRPNSNSRKVAERLLSAYQRNKVEAQLLDLGELPTDIFTPEVYSKRPESMTPFVEMILSSDGLHVVTPEYNGGFPGILKYFIDLLPFPESFAGRPVAFTGVAAGQFGALRPVEQLQQLFSYQNALLFPTRVFAMGIGISRVEAGPVADEKLEAPL